MGRITQTIWIADARDGAVERMPSVLGILAERLRAGELDDGERAFLADALDEIASAADPARHAASALLLVRPRGRVTRSQAAKSALQRARLVQERIAAGATREAAIGAVADAEGVDDSQVRKAWDSWREKLRERDRQNAEDYAHWMKQKARDMRDAGATWKEIAMACVSSVDAVKAACSE